MVSAGFVVGDTEPSQATRRDEGSARDDQKGDRIRQIASLGLQGAGAVAGKRSRGSAPIALLRLLPSENRSPHPGARGGALHDS
jgi:hypothetical protein